MATESCGVNVWTVGTERRRDKDNNDTHIRAQGVRDRCVGGGRRTFIMSPGRGGCTGKVEPWLVAAEGSGQVDPYWFHSED